MYKELKKLDIKMPNNPIKKWGTDLSREFSTEEFQMAKRHLTKRSMPLAIRNANHNKFKTSFYTCQIG